MQKKRLFQSLALFLSLLLALPALAGCGDAAGEPPNADGVTIITTLFPLYDFARALTAGTDANVTLLLPPGVESHSFEPSPADIIAIQKADVFAYTGEYMETWAHEIIDGLDGTQGTTEDGTFLTIGSLVVADCSLGIQLDEIEAHADAQPHEGHGHGNYDPHIWTDPTQAATMAGTLTEALSAVDPEHAETYRANCEAYQAELAELDADFMALMSGAKRSEICFGGRFALHYFAKRYGLSYIAAFDSCSSETEPSAKAVAEITDAILADGIPVIYYEELVDPKVSRSIAEDTGCKMLLLHSCHNVSKDELDAGATYLSLMRQNLENLKVGLY